MSKGSCCWGREWLNPLEREKHELEMSPAALQPQGSSVINTGVVPNPASPHHQL